MDSRSATISSVLDGLDLKDGKDCGGKTDSTGSAIQALMAERERSRQTVPQANDFIKLKQEKDNPIVAHLASESIGNKYYWNGEQDMSAKLTAKGGGKNKRGQVPAKSKRALIKKGEMYQDKFQEKLASKSNRKNRLNELKRIN